MAKKVRVLLASQKEGGRTVVVAPDGAVLPNAPRLMTTTADPSLLKALGRAFRWKRLLDDGTYASVSEIARAEKLDRTYVGDVLRLTLLAPEIVEAILEGRQAEGMTLPRLLLKRRPPGWVQQRLLLAMRPPDAAGHKDEGVTLAGAAVGHPLCRHRHLQCKEEVWGGGR